MKFPLYRKYFNGKSYFKIHSEKHFEEVHIIGSQQEIIDVVANQYPEMLRIKEMIACKDDVWQEISEQDYLDIR